MHAATILFTAIGQSSAKEQWDIMSFFDGALGFTEKIGGGALALTGMMTIIWGGALLSEKLMMPPGTSAVTWSKITGMLLIGPALVVGGFYVTESQSPDTGDNGAKSSVAQESTLSTSTSSAPTTTEAQKAATPPVTTEAPKKQADPIRLPKIENAETAGFGLVALLIAIALGIIGAKAFHKRSLRKEAEAEIELIQISRRKTWGVYKARHANLKKKFYESQTDWQMLFDFPSLQDLRVPETQELIKALDTADAVDSTIPSSIDIEESLTEYAYPKAVDELGKTWEIALSHAKRVGQKGLSKNERYTIAKIRKALTLAERGATDGERANAYATIKRLIGELETVVLPERALQAIEAKHMLAIEAGRHVQTNPLIAASERNR